MDDTNANEKLKAEYREYRGLKLVQIKVVRTTLSNLEDKLNEVMQLLRKDGLKQIATTTDIKDNGEVIAIIYYEVLR